jgi:hypothetical protein
VCVRACVRACRFEWRRLLPQWRGSTAGGEATQAATLRDLPKLSRLTDFQPSPQSRPPSHIGRPQVPTALKKSFYLCHSSCSHSRAKKHIHSAVRCVSNHSVIFSLEILNLSLGIRYHFEVARMFLYGLTVKIS